MVLSEFDIACDFYKTHINKAFKLTYDQRLTLSALFNQAKHGPFSFDQAPDLGFFDFIGKERRAKWQVLGNMSQAEAQDTFCQLFLTICPQFAAYLEAIDAIPCHNGANTQSDDRNDFPPTAVHERIDHSNSTDFSSNFGLRLSSSQESRIRDALNTQTLNQFRAYSAQYYPDNEAEQSRLITQLQDRHFHQYMAYIANNPSAQSSTLLTDDSLQNPKPATPVLQTVLGDGSASVEDQSHHSTSIELTNETPNSSSINNQQTKEGDLVAHIPDGRDHVMSPQMWTRSDIVEFKTHLGKDPASVINVGSGELVTIRVPVISSGNCLVWEFATDSYDIGFGLSFEWPPESVDSTGKPPDGSEPETGDVRQSKAPWNLVQASSQPHENSKDLLKVDVEELIPVYRRTSHTEVYCGSHTYPVSSGTYLLKFDNTYSIWRNKLLYYRVYCTQ